MGLLLKKTGTWGDGTQEFCPLSGEADRKQNSEMRHVVEMKA